MVHPAEYSASSSGYGGQNKNKISKWYFHPNTLSNSNYFHEVCLISNPKWISLWNTCPFHTWTHADFLHPDCPFAGSSQPTVQGTTAGWFSAWLPLVPFVFYGPYVTFKPIASSPSHLFSTLQGPFGIVFHNMEAVPDLLFTRSDKTPSWVEEPSGVHCSKCRWSMHYTVP